jgi:alkylation response protein AidB-like acyl-CoA dehydrogenase
MHHYWVGTAADSWRAGDKSVGFIFEEAGKGEVFAAGHAEPGNEMSIVFSATKAEKVAGGYTFTGRKAFGSLSPVWTRLGLHCLDTSDPASPKVVHGFLPRNSPGVTIKETWDVLGMRATRSDDTVLDGAFVPDKYIARVVSAGLAGADYFILSIFLWALGGFGNIYYGLAQRLLELTVEHVKAKQPVTMARSYAHHPEAQRGVAEIVMALEGVGAQLDAVTNDWSNGVQHPDWPIKIIAAKYNAVETAWKIADRALEVSGGFGMSRRARWSGCSGTRAPGVSIRRTPRSRTSWSASSCWASIPTIRSAGDKSRRLHGEDEDNGSWKRSNGANEEQRRQTSFR